MTIRSNPPGATVYIDDQEIGTTPVSTSFVYYGTRKIQLVRDGYETQSVLHKVRPPWYQIPPLDFVTENLWPTELRDERVVNIEMEPQRVVTTEELLARAQQLRGDAQATRSLPATTPAVPEMLPAPVDPLPQQMPAAPADNLPPPFYPR